jgi:hypothetical protein
MDRGSPCRRPREPDALQIELGTLLAITIAVLIGPADTTAQREAWRRIAEEREEL